VTLRHFGPGITDGPDYLPKAGPEDWGCGANPPDPEYPYNCTLPAGHESDHAAHGTSGMVARWPVGPQDFVSDTL
jgi:hypothetical protein